MLKKTKKHIYKPHIFFLIISIPFIFAACNNVSGEEISLSATGTPTPTPTGWLDRLRKDGWIDISQDWSETDTSNPENYLKYSVSTSRTVQLGDFEYTLTLPKTVYRLSELQNGTDVIEVTATLRYTGERESITISARDSVFYLEGITDTYDNWDGGGSYDIGMEHVITKGEDMTLTRAYDEYSKAIQGPGPGLIMLAAEFGVIDENGNETEDYDFLLSVPYDVLE